jgi:dihydrofolate reductase
MANRKGADMSERNGRVIVTNHLTLDGVMQAPAGPDEDPRDGFEHGGWASRNTDSVLGSFLGERLGQGEGGAMLFGRRTYEQFATFWPNQPDDNPFAAVLNNCTKYVASRTLKAPLEWENSTLLEGDAADAVAKLKEQPGGDLAVLGSGELVQSLMRRDLVDEFVLMIHPLIFGKGRRLFDNGGAFASLKLVESRTTTTGVVIAVYQPA